jgi:hypothetical protein
LTSFSERTLFRASWPSASPMECSSRSRIATDPITCRSLRRRLWVWCGAASSTRSGGALPDMVPNACSLWRPWSHHGLQRCIDPYQRRCFRGNAGRSAQPVCGLYDSSERAGVFHDCKRIAHLLVLELRSSCCAPTTAVRAAAQERGCERSRSFDRR